MKGKYWSLLGNAEVLVRGLYLEKFINIASQAGIRLWDMSKTPEELRFKTDLTSIKKLKEIQEKTGYEITISRKSGILIAARFLLRRKLLLAGFFCFCFCLYYLSGLVWQVELSGMENLDKTKVVDFIQEHGLRKWAQFRDLDLDKLEQLIYRNFPQVAWVAIDRSGTRVSIRIVEKEYDPMQSGEAIDIVAEFDGIISEMVVLQGIPMVDKGMTVARGDLLIAGYQEADRIVNAAGSVKAVVYFEGYGEAACEEVEREFTGIERTQMILELGNWEIPLSRRVTEFDDYQLVESVRFLRGNSNFPIRLRVKTYKEVKLKFNEYSPEHAREQARNRAMLMVHNQIPEHADILETEVQDISQDGAIYRFHVALSVETKIGRNKVRGD